MNDGQFYTPTSPASNDLKTNEQQEVAESAEGTRKQLLSLLPQSD